MQSFHTIFIKLYHAYMGKLRPLLMEAGLSNGQPKILHYLIEHDKCLQKEIADTYHIEPATVSKLLAGMEEQGLVTREVPLTNKRAIFVRITPKGKKAYEQFEIAKNELLLSAQYNFSDDEKQTFLIYLERLLKNLES